MSEAPTVSKFDPHHGAWQPFRGDWPGQSRRLRLLGSTGFGAGFTRVERTCELEFYASSDQLLYVVSGELRVTPRSAPTDPSAATVSAHSGEVVQIRRGAHVLLGVVGHGHFFYVLSPDIDWRKQLESPA